MTKIAFICVHNSCRSQIAEALCKRFGKNIVECYSAGRHCYHNGLQCKLSFFTLQISRGLGLR